MKTKTTIIVKTVTTIDVGGAKQSTTTIETDGDLTLDQIRTVLERPSVPRSWWTDIFGEHGFWK